MSNHRTVFRIVLLLLGVCGCFGIAAAATEGKIAGTVRDAATGAPLPNANVTILNSTLGAASMSDGSYFILNVPAGTYSVQASVMGYKPVVMDNVLVTPDFTTDVLFMLEQTVTALLDPVGVEASRPLIQRDATSTVRILDSKDYEKLPTRGYQDAASIQAGVVSSKGTVNINVQGNETTNNPLLFIRGGRANEVAYFVDGFSQQDPLTGYSTTSINTNAVDQVVVMTGGFNAEYGRVMSGAVNVVTKEGRADYFGTLEAVTDNLSGDWVGAKKYDYNIYAGSLGGPIVPGSDVASFFVSGERRWQRDRAPRALTDGPLPANWLDGWTWQGKVNVKVSPAVNLKAGTLGSRDDWREYYHQYAYVPDHMPRYEDRNASFFTTLTTSLAKDTYFNLSANYFLTTRESGDGVYFDDLMSYARLVANADNATGYDTLGNRNMDEYALFWKGPSDSHPGRVWDDYQHRDSKYIGFTGDLTHKWSEHNTIKVGGDFQRHTLRFYQHLFPTDAIYGIDLAGYQDVVAYGFDLTGQEEVDDAVEGYEDGAKHPITASFFTQNKYEYNDFVVNAGLRYDYLDPSTLSLVNANLPLGLSDDNLGDDDLEDSKQQHKVSPRLGVGFPISPTLLFHANYGKFFQQPNLQDLYTSYRYLEYKVANGGYYFPFGNPNLAPETTTAYEVGVTRQLAPRVRLDVTAYYKDVQDLVQVQNVPSAPTNFASYRNTDFGTIKGLDLNVQLIESRGISGSASYSLSWSNGTGSVSDSQRDMAWTNAETPKQTAPLSFDQRHKVTLNVDYRSRAGAGPLVGSVRPLENFGINLLFNAGSGFPVTPIFATNEVTLASVTELPKGTANSMYGPWTYQLDAKLSRSFPISSVDVEAYVWVLNLLDTENQLSIYGSSGSAYTTGWLSTEEGRAWAAANGAEGLALYQQKERNPLNFGIPRMVRFGLKTSF